MQYWTILIGISMSVKVVRFSELSFVLTLTWEIPLAKTYANTGFWRGFIPTIDKYYYKNYQHFLRKLIDILLIYVTAVAFWYMTVWAMSCLTQQIHNDLICAAAQVPKRITYPLQVKIERFTAIGFGLNF